MTAVRAYLSGVIINPKTTSWKCILLSICFKFWFVPLSRDLISTTRGNTPGYESIKIRKSGTTLRGFDQDSLEECSSTSSPESSSVLDSLSDVDLCDDHGNGSLSTGLFQYGSTYLLSPANCSTGVMQGELCLESSKSIMCSHSGWSLINCLKVCFSQFFAAPFIMLCSNAVRNQVKKTWSSGKIHKKTCTIRMPTSWWIFLWTNLKILPKSTRSLKHNVDHSLKTFQN